MEIVTDGDSSRRSGGLLRHLDVLKEFSHDNYDFLAILHSCGIRLLFKP